MVAPAAVLAAAVSTNPTITHHPSPQEAEASTGRRSVDPETEHSAMLPIPAQFRRSRESLIVLFRHLPEIRHPGIRPRRWIGTPEGTLS